MSKLTKCLLLITTIGTVLRLSAFELPVRFRNGTIQYIEIGDREGEETLTANELLTIISGQTGIPLHQIRLIFPGGKIVVKDTESAPMKQAYLERLGLIDLVQTTDLEEVGPEYFGASAGFVSRDSGAMEDFIERLKLLEDDVKIARLIARIKSLAPEFDEHIIDALETTEEKFSLLKTEALRLARIARTTKY